MPKAQPYAFTLTIGPDGSFIRAGEQIPAEWGEDCIKSLVDSGGAGTKAEAEQFFAGTLTGADDGTLEALEYVAWMEKQGMKLAPNHFTGLDVVVKSDSKMAVR